MSEPEGLETRSNGERLLEQGRKLREILRAQARRAFVVEFTGTPKAGKSTSVETLRRFFKDAGFQVHLLRERAADCPLPMKGHFFFNAWTTATMLAEVLETHETNVDLLILDRGFFDALVWLELQDKRGQLSVDEKKVFKDFVLLERWRGIVDCTVVMTVDPAVAVEREDEKHIVPRRGASLMNPSALTEFNLALEDAIAEYDRTFDIVRKDTSNPTQGVIPTTSEIVSELLDRMRRWADPDIAVVSKDVVARLFDIRTFYYGNEAYAALSTLQQSVSFKPRSEAENDPDLVQLVAAGVLKFEDRMVVFERETIDKKSGDYGQRKLWIGCHVEGTTESMKSLVDAAILSLKSRLAQELHLSSSLLGQPELRGLAWDHSNPERRRRASDVQPCKHLGIMFESNIPEHVAKQLQNKQFKRMGRAGRLKSMFMSPIQILEDIRRLDLEPWSDHYVRNVGQIRPKQKTETP